MSSYLLDTNILINLFSKYTHAATKQLLKKYKKNATFYICGIVLSEFYQGISQQEAEYYSALLDGYPYVHSARAIYEKAGLMAHRLRRQGHNIPLGDCIVGTTAKHYQLILLTFDQHLKKIPGIKIHFLSLLP